MQIGNAMIAVPLMLAALGCGDGSSAVFGDGGASPGDPNGPGSGDGSGGGGAGSCRDCADSSTGTPSGGACSLVDLIIAVDASSSMTEELKAMRTDIFPAFAERLARVGKGLENFRVATIDACPNPATYHTRGARNACNFSSGEAWIDSTSPDLESEFACVGDIYEDDVECSGSNDDEQPASAAAASLEPPFANNANEGFSRPDALLVILAITDEDEQPTGAARSAQQVFERIVATKGDVSRVVFIGIGGSRSCEGVYGSAAESVKLKNITQRFIDRDRGVWHDLCVGQIEDSLDEAFAVINRACDEFVPVI